MTIDIRTLDKAAVLAALYNHSKVQGMGFLHAKPGPMTVDEARSLLANGRVSFDYLYGRVMKVDLSGDSFDPRVYDRDNGAGAAERVLSVLRARVEAE
jgi:hypothetical protein